MKFRKVWFAPLVLLCLGGAGVGTKMTFDARTARTGSSAALSPGEGSKRASSKTKPRGKKSDAESLKEIRRLLQNESRSVEQEIYASLQVMIDSLSLEAVLELLDDREIFAEIELLDGVPKFPLRPFIHGSLWHRLGELAPELALEKAFPKDGNTIEREGHAADLLQGIAKVNRELAFAAWQSHFGNSGDEEVVSPMGFFVMDLFEEWGKTSSATAFAALEGLPEQHRKKAYMGYIQALPEGTDWKAESGKFEKLFPASKDRSFSSQSAVCSLATCWAISDPDAAFAWMESLPDVETPIHFASWDVPGSERFDAYGQVVAAWMRAEPMQAAEWLKTWKAPGNSDRFYARIIQYRGSEDVAVSSTALELISDPAIRDEVVREVLTHDWQKREVLRSWEKSPQLSPAVRAEVTEAIRVRDEKGSGWTL